MVTVRAGVAATLLSAAIGVPAADARASGDSPEAQAVKQQARTLRLRAERLVRRDHASCRYRSPSGALRLGEGAAGPAVASVLGVFRRPATAEEQALAVRRLTDPGDSGFGDATLPRDGVRVVRDGGREVVLMALRDVPPAEPDRASYDRCTSLLAGEIARLAPTVSPAVAATAERVEGVLRRNGRPPAVQPRTESLIVSETSPGKTAVGQSGAMSFDPALFRRTGESGGWSLSGGRRTRLTFIVPDGVATIDATFPRVLSRGPSRPDKHFPTTIRQRLTVRDNVAFTTVHRPPDDAQPRMVWRAADGSVVRRLPA